jgi:ribosomal protein S18 acetylase RimI-like enzyme
VSIERVGTVTGELVEAFARLTPQLSARAAPPSAAQLAAVVADPRAALLVARGEDGVITGTLTLVTYRIPTAHHGRIEYVIVDESARGQGVGEALTREALRLGAEWKLDAISLTSRPARESANRLYQRLGFEQRETNVYVWRAL